MRTVRNSLFPGERVGELLGEAWLYEIRSKTGEDDDEG